MKLNEMGLAVRLMVGLSIGAGLASCAPGTRGGPAAPEGAGTFRMALVATTNGNTYRLRQAIFQIAGPDQAALDSDAQPDATVLTASLSVGSYTATLAPGWFLER